MKTVEVNVYSYDELSEDAKQNALESLYDINVDYQWWEYLFDDAKAIGLEISEFDIYYRIITGNLLWSASEVKKEVMKYHGKSCNTYQTVKSFDLRKKDFDEDDFKQSLLADYLILLDNEYEYLTSKEAIEETIRANEYEFTENGEIF